MILVDFSAVMYSVVFISEPEKGLDEKIFRHKLLTTLLSFKKKFERDYGEIVIAMDGPKYWRRQVFKHYKASRAKTKEESNIDWDEVFKVTGKVTEEIREVLPWKFIHLHGAEADDVIAVLARKVAQHEKVLILSRDKDFAQLQINPNVSQYSPITKSWIKSANPELDLKKLIITGDVGDGIPNIFSPADAFVNHIRQSPCTEKKLKACLESPDVMYRQYKERWELNRQLIDFSFIPCEIENNILAEIEKEAKGSQSKLYKYFVANRMAQLLSSVQEFTLRARSVKGNEDAIHSEVSVLEKFLG